VPLEVLEEFFVRLVGNEPQRPRANRTCRMIGLDVAVV